MKTGKFYILGICSLFLAQVSFADEQDRKLPDQFQYSLSGLKESMKKLEEGNASFNLQILAFKQEQERLKNFLKELEGQEEVLERKSESFEASAEEKKKLLTDLQIQLENISGNLEQVNKDFNLKQDRWSQLQAEELKPAVKKESQPEVPPADANLDSQDSLAQLRQEKLKLIKEILESQKRQQLLQEDLINLKKSLQRPVVSGLDSLKEKNEDLKAQLANLENQLKDISALEIAPQNVALEKDDQQAQKLIQIHKDVEELKKRKEELAVQIQGTPVEQTKAPVDNEMALNDKKRLEEHYLQQKKDNRLLQQQAKELKAEMVSLDKKKEKIEAKFKKIK